MLKASKSITYISMLCLALACSGLQAKTVWRCGDGGRTYSETPCPGGKAVNVADTRTSADVQAAQDSVKRSQDLADRMRQQRLEDEKRNLAANAGAANLGPSKAKPAKAEAAVKPKKKSKHHHPKVTAEDDGTWRAAAAPSRRKRD